MPLGKAKSIGKPQEDYQHTPAGGGSLATGEGQKYWKTSGRRMPQNPIKHVNSIRGMTQNPIKHVHPIRRMAQNPIKHVHSIRRMAQNPIKHVHSIRRMAENPIKHVHSIRRKMKVFNEAQLSAYPGRRRVTCHWGRPKVLENLRKTISIPQPAAVHLPLGKAKSIGKPQEDGCHRTP